MIVVGIQSAFEKICKKNKKGVGEKVTMGCPYYESTNNKQ